MSSPIWTPAALSSEAKAYKAKGWRLVEAQHRVSTLKLVDSLEDQLILENLIEATKPIVPLECRHLDYLLSTPFRYDAPYPHGSRFRRAGRTAGVFYAAEHPETALAEMAFYRLLFFADSPDTPWPSDAAEYTAFAVALDTGHALDLTIPPLSLDAANWTHLTDYSACQNLADAARQADVQIIRYQSVRDPHRRANVAVLHCAAFAQRQPVARQTWRMKLSATGVIALCEFPRSGVSFDKDAFANDDRIANMRWNRQ